MSLLHLHRRLSQQEQALNAGGRNASALSCSAQSPLPKGWSNWWKMKFYSLLANNELAERKHPRRRWGKGSSSVFPVSVSGYGSPFSNNSSKCCPADSQNLTEEACSCIGLHELLSCIWWDLPGGSASMSIGWAPMDKCHENCTRSLCCVKILARRAEKESKLLYSHLTNTPFFSFPDVALPSLLF